MALWRQVLLGGQARWAGSGGRTEGIAQVNRGRGSCVGVCTRTVGARRTALCNKSVALKRRDAGECGRAQACHVGDQGTGWVTVWTGLGWAWHGGKLKRHALSLMSFAGECVCLAAVVQAE